MQVFKEFPQSKDPPKSRLKQVKYRPKEVCGLPTSTGTAQSLIELFLMTCRLGRLTPQARRVNVMVQVSSANTLREV